MVLAQHISGQISVPPSSSVSVGSLGLKQNAVQAALILLLGAWLAFGAPLRVRGAAYRRAARTGLRALGLLLIVWGALVVLAVLCGSV